MNNQTGCESKKEATSSSFGLVVAIVLYILLVIILSSFKAC